MATQLGLYNAALRHIGERKLAALSENTEPRRALDEVYADTAVFLHYILEQGYWKFALRTTKLTYNPDVTVEFGLQRAFAKPSDFRKMHKIASDEYMQAPLLNYTEEAGYWYSDIDDIYVSYISDDTSYGLDLSAWPATFATYAGYYLATLVAERLAPAMDTTTLFSKMSLALADAQAKDAMEGPTVFPPAGGWVSARRRGPQSIRDRGKRGQLIG